MSAITPLIRGENGVSGTKIWLSVFAAIVCVKFAVSGVSIDPITIGAISTPAIDFGTFDTTAATAILGVFGTLYGYRRKTELSRDESKGSP